MSSNDEKTGRDERIGEIIACYLDACQAGEVQSPEEIFFRYPEFEKIVAIKAAKERLATPADAERLRTEAQRAAHLRHPNIVGPCIRLRSTRGIPSS